MRTALALLALLISALGPGARGAPAPGLRHGKLPPRGASLPKGHPRVRQPPAAGLQPNVWQRCNYNFNLSRTVANGPPVSLTQYWIAIEGSYDLSDTWDSQILLTGIKNLTIPECDQYGRKISASTLGKTDKLTLGKCYLEGTCRLLSGLTINLGNSGSSSIRANTTGLPIDACFIRSYAPYGLGSQGNALRPWTSIAVNNLRFGTILFAPALKGVEIPGTENARGIRMKHNGCLRVDDIGWSLHGCHVDLFVYSYWPNYATFGVNLPTAIYTRVSNSTACPILNYPVVLAPHPALPKTTSRKPVTTVRKV